MSQRQQEILSVVDTLISEYDKWSDDPLAAKSIDEDSPLDDAMFIAITTCETGDVPSECRELVGAMGRLGLEFRSYRDGNADARTLEPLPQFYAAYRAMIDARAGATGPSRRVVEPVKLLREQKVTDLQIARMYGGSVESHTGQRRWFGPFFDERGIVLPEKIQAEADKPGSVIGEGWVHPLDVMDEKQRASELAARMNRLKEKIEEDKPPTFTEGDVVKYLKEGAFAHQAARLFRIPVGEVYRIAAKYELKVNGGDQAGSMVPPTVDPTQTTNHEAKNDLIADEEMRRQIIQLGIEEKIPVPDVAKTVSKQFRSDVSVVHVTSVIREERKRREDAKKLTPQPSAA